MSSYGFTTLTRKIENYYIIKGGTYPDYYYYLKKKKMPTTTASTTNGHQLQVKPSSTNSPFEKSVAHSNNSKNNNRNDDDEATSRHHQQRKNNLRVSTTATSTSTTKTSPPSVAFPQSDTPAEPKNDNQTQQNAPPQTAKTTSTSTEASSPFAQRRPKWWSESDMLCKALGTAYCGEHKLGLTVMKASHVHEAIRICDKLFHTKPAVPQFVKEKKSRPRRELREQGHDQDDTNDEEEANFKKTYPQEAEPNYFESESPSSSSSSSYSFPSYCGFPFVFSCEEQQFNNNHQNNTHSKNDNNNVINDDENDDNDEDESRSDQQSRAPAATSIPTNTVNEERFFKAWFCRNSAWSVPRSLISRRANKKGGAVATTFSTASAATSPLIQKKKLRFAQADILRPWHRVAVIDDIPFESEFLLNAEVEGQDCYCVDDDDDNSNDGDETSIDKLASSIRDQDLLLDTVGSCYSTVSSPASCSASSSSSLRAVDKMSDLVAERFGIKLWEKMMENFSPVSATAPKLPLLYPENDQVPIAPGSFQDIMLLHKVNSLRKICSEIYQTEDEAKSQQIHPTALSCLRSDNGEKATDAPATSDSSSRSKISPPPPPPSQTQSQPSQPPPPALDEQNVFSLARTLRRCSKFHHQEILKPEKMNELARHIVRFAGELFKSGIFPFSEVAHDAFSFRDDRKCCVEQIKMKSFSVLGDDDDDKEARGGGGGGGGIKIELEDEPSDFMKLQITGLCAISEPFKIVVKPASWSNRTCDAASPSTSAFSSNSSSNHHHHHHHHQHQGQRRTDCGLLTKYTLRDGLAPSSKTRKEQQREPLDEGDEQEADLANTNPADVARSVTAALAGEYVQYDVDVSDDDDDDDNYEDDDDDHHDDDAKGNNFAATSATTINTFAGGSATRQQDDEHAAPVLRGARHSQQQHQHRNEKGLDKEKSEHNNDNDDGEQPLELSVQLKLKQLDASVSFDVRHVYGTSAATPVIRHVEVRLRHFAVVAEVKDAPFKSLLVKLVCGAFRPLIRAAVERGIASAISQMAPSPEEMDKLRRHEKDMDPNQSENVENREESDRGEWNKMKSRHENEEHLAHANREDRDRDGDHDDDDDEFDIGINSNNLHVHL